MRDHFVRTGEDVLDLLDTLLATGPGWDKLFQGREGRAGQCPFLVDWPDENLAEWFGTGLLTTGRVLELGCGHGRNATYLASLGCRVDAVDSSAQAIAWARDRASKSGVTVTFSRRSIFEIDAGYAGYDLVYDSGCFHHLAPHRREDYLNLVGRALKPGGSFGLVCFRPEGGSGLTDLQVYQRASLGGGLGYSEDQLRALWDAMPFSIRVLRPMATTQAQGPHFGEDFLWTLLASKTR
jgi:SAM-dependent methyltransferase